MTVLPPQPSVYSNQETLTQKLKPQKPFYLSPAPQGSAYTDTSINHDAVLAEFTLSNKLSSDYNREVRINYPQ